MKSILIVVALILPAFAREQTWTWDIPEGTPPDGYEIAVRATEADPWEVIGETQEVEFTHSFSDASFQIAVRAFTTLTASDGSDSGRLESDWSPHVEVPVKPSIPSPKLKVTVEIQTSDNLTDWRHLATIEYPAPDRHFIRLKE